MAVGKIIKGSHFGAAVRYLLGEGNEPRENAHLPTTPDEWIAPGYEKNKRARILQTNLFGTNQKEWKKEFETMNSLREGGRELKDPMRHFTFSLKPGESLSTAKWQELSENLLGRMGYKDSPYLVIQHRERDHEHIHIITSRITYGGKTVSDSFEKDRLRTFAREIERQHNLTPTPQRAEKKTKTKGEAELTKRTGEPTLREQIQIQIDAIKKEKRGAAEFAKELRQQGVFIKPNIQKSGKVVGVSFGKADENGKVWAFKGSDLGRKYKWSELAKDIDYAPERDADVFVEAKREAERAERGELTRPVLPAAEKVAVREGTVPMQYELAFGTTELRTIEPQTERQPKIRDFRAESREKLIAELVAQHNEEAKIWKGAAMPYRELKRLAKFYRENGDKPPTEKQLERFSNLQKQFKTALPSPQTLLAASIITLDNVADAERSNLLRQQLQNISDFVKREQQQQLQSVRSTAGGNRNELSEKTKRFQQTDEARERGFSPRYADGNQLGAAIEQMETADAVQERVSASLKEQGIELEPLAQRILSRTIDGLAKQEPTVPEMKRAQEIAAWMGGLNAPKNRLEAISYVTNYAGEQERDELAAGLGHNAVKQALEERKQQIISRTQTQEQPQHEESKRDDRTNNRTIEFER